MPSEKNYHFCSPPLPNCIICQVLFEGALPEFWQNQMNCTMEGENTSRVLGVLFCLMAVLFADTAAVKTMSSPGSGNCTSRDLISRPCERAHNGTGGV